jgi:hypothetical protein
MRRLLIAAGLALSVRRFLISLVACLVWAGRLPAQADAGAWRIEESRSEMTDLPIVSVSVRATAPIPGPVGKPVWPLLFVSCREGKLLVALDVEQVLDGNPGRLVRLRIRWDEQPPTDDLWIVGDSYRTAFVYEHAESSHAEEDFIQDLLHSRKLRIEFPVFAAGRYVATFDVRGLNVHMPKLRCVFPPDQVRDSTPTAAGDTAAAWQIHEGLGTVSASLRTTVGQAEELRLFVGCQGRTLAAFITGDPVVHRSEGGVVPIRLRWDDQEPVTENWTKAIGTAGALALAPDPVGFIKTGLLRSRGLRLEFLRGSKNYYVARFNVRGLAAHMSKLRCVR